MFIYIYNALKKRTFQVWATWLMTCGLLRHLGLLARDRLEYMTLSVNTTRGAYIRLASLLGLVLVGALLMTLLGLSVFGCLPHSLHPLFRVIT